MITALIQAFIEQLLNEKATFIAIGGGSINHTYRINAGKQTFFCKLNSNTELPGMFDAEQSGLALLASQQVIRIPRVIAKEEKDGTQLLILEWVEQGVKTDAFWDTFGRQLAALHHVHYSQYGLATNNYMGALPQNNQFTGSWIEFFVRQRLQPQITLALSNKLLEPAHVKQFEKLYQQLAVMFSVEPPTLLHGDLWSGNFLCDEKGKPVLIDPAVYYGHRSMDLAMTTLFGGFDARFYESYNYHFPLPANYREQWEVCNLYPLLIHLNLFGKSYLPGILNTIRQY
ncbi:MAG TPA: fructosamine kinase family protein [Niastella sp.]|nr:fructosamine kinase family protein [Niastella sp.]